ncbi:MAG: HAD family hydrolase [Algibacter sp.]|uniref:HAD family hydrolase n=1 Tax=Algibacter sp. TaxID=1872428 RepID=UPI003298C73C
MRTILWDFDGVILDSMKVRDFGFREIFKAYKKNDVDNLINYHRINGGLSRYVKIVYFFEEILNQKITSEEVQEYASKFSDIMRIKLINTENLISESVSFIEDNYRNFNFHIVSGSDGNELNFLCNELNISKYFISIQGSPTPKNELVANLLEKHGYDINATCLIGDSINDYEAAIVNNISFYGFNNEDLYKSTENYIKSFLDFKF